MNHQMRRYAIALLLALPIAGAKADFEEALARYKAKDYPTALSEFKRLAIIGGHSSQFNLGVMYLYGEGLEKDPVQAYAWMALACQESHREWLKARDVVYASLSDSDKLHAKEVATDLFKQFSDTALARDMAPNLAGTESQFQSSRPIKRVTPEYPISMRRFGESGQVTLRFAVAPDGTTRLHSLVEWTSFDLVAPALDAIKQFRYQPSRVNGRPVEEFGLLVTFEFKISDANYDEQRIYKVLNSYRAWAQKGDGSDAYAYASAISRYSTFVKLPPGTENPNYWFWQAASKGDPRAQFELGNNLLYGNMCSADVAKGITWLKRSAELGQAEAEYVLGIDMLSGAHFAQDRTLAIKWLERAADHDFSSAKLRLAWVYATSPDPQIRNPDRAEVFLKRISEEFIDKLTLRQTEAAVAAAKGDYAQAVRLQQAAISEAEHYDLPVDELRLQLQAYKDGRTWVDQSA